jgi:hypothetical protein
MGPPSFGAQNHLFGLTEQARTEPPAILVAARAARSLGSGRSRCGAGVALAQTAAHRRRPRRAADAGGEGIWPTLRDHLAQAQFDVLVDRDVIQPGDIWRSEIYGWIGLCDAAVILISQQAIDDPEKQWVARETACLICRRYIDPSLKIIPVLLDGIDFKKLEATERFRIVRRDG